MGGLWHCFNHIIQLLSMRYQRSQDATARPLAIATEFRVEVEPVVAEGACNDPKGKFSPFCTSRGFLSHGGTPSYHPF